MFFRTPFSRVSVETIALALIITAVAFSARQVSAAGAWCAAPYVNVAGQGTPPNGGDTTHELQIQSISFGEPFNGNCNEKSLTVVIKVSSLDPGGAGMVTPAYNTEWEAEFVVPGTVTSDNLSHTVFVSWDTQTVPTGSFNYGFLDTSSTPNFYYSQCGVTGACAATGTATADGTITIKLNYSTTLSFANNTATVFTMGAIPAGTTLTSIAGHIWTCACAAGNGLLVTQSTATGLQNYTVEGNTSCSTLPVAALTASTNSGSAPLTVNFDASGSSIPAGGCGTITSYIFDFGDMTGATQSTPTVSHTYSGCGVTYPARVRVVSSLGLTSTNNAEQDITMGSCGPPQLTSVASRMTHTGVGDFDIVLPQPPAARNVECRTSAALGAGNYKLVFTFLNNLVSVVSASVTGGAGSVLNNGLGPNPNQYTVNLTGVSSRQSTTVTLHTVVDASGSSGDVPATMGVLVGDVNATARVDAADVSLVRQQALQTITASNFREDINATGRIDAADVSIARQNALQTLP